MRIQVWGEQPKTEAFVRLIEQCGTVYLVEVDDSGEIVDCGYIAQITPQGIVLEGGYDGELLERDDGVVRVITSEVGSG